MMLPLAMSLTGIGMTTLLVLGFGFVIFWHELGHFLAAKWVGIRVEQFAVGFGHALVSWRKGIGFRVGNTQKEYREKAQAYLARKGDQSVAEAGYSDAQIGAAGDEMGLGQTEYRLNWIPLGGYVKMLGQDDLKPDAIAEDPNAYNKKSVPARMLVISAGVIMNIILAAIMFMVLFLIGFNVAPAWVGNLVPGSPAQKAGLKVGDHILYFDGKSQDDFTKITLNTALAPAGPVPMVIDRPDPNDPSKLTRMELTVTPARSAADKGFLQIGFSAPAKLAGVKKGPDVEYDKQKLVKYYPAEALLIEPGDNIIAVNGQPVNVDDFIKFDAILQSSYGKPISLTIESADKQVRKDQVFQPHFEEPFVGPFNIAGFLPRSAIYSIQESSPLVDLAQPGDVIEALRDVDTLPHPSRDALMDRLAKDAEGGKALSFDLLRNDKPEKVGPISKYVSLGEGRKGLGIVPTLDEQHTVVAGVVSDSAAAASGFKGGEKILSISGKPVATWYDVHRILSGLQPSATDKTVTVKIQCDDGLAGTNSKDLKLSEADLTALRQIRYQSTLALAEYTKPRKTTSPLIAAKWGVTETRDFILQFYLTLRRMVSGSISPSNMMGPVGIFYGGSRFAQKGMDWLIWFLAMISANLAVVNFLPIPVVDGGQFMFLILEKIKGSPLSPRAMAIAQYVGLAFLAAVVLFVTYHDILRMV